MTPRERILATLAGRPTDRVPFGLTFAWSPWGQTLERWRLESGNPHLDVARELDYDAGFVLPRLELGPFPRFGHVVISQDGDFVVYRDWRGITMRQRRDGGSMPDFIDYPVKTPADWERVKAERYDISRPGRVAEDLAGFKQRSANRAVQVGEFPWGVFGTVRDLLGAEGLLMALYDEPAMVHDMMDHLTSLWLGVYEQVAGAVQIDHIHIWEDMSGRGGSLISPAMVQEFMMPCYDRIARFARDASVPIVSVDSDGDCSQLIPIMMEHGVNLFFPFEVQAGSDILAYRRDYPTLGILGGLDKRALAADKQAIDVEISRCAEMLTHGRYIPAWDHLIPPDVPWDNIKYAAGRIRDLCRSQPNRLS